MLSGRRLGIQGDSFSAGFKNAWQQVVLDRTGMTLVYQDARSGRQFSEAFECYGTTTPGTPLGVFNSQIAPNKCFRTAGSDGNTLAQNIAGVDILVIQLGTNDQNHNVPLGFLGDPANAGTFFGNMRWVAENYLAAKPTMRVVFITPPYNKLVTTYTYAQVADAEVAYGKSMALPVIDINARGGVNALTAPVLLQADGVHPTSLNFSTYYGPTIAQELTRIF